MTQEEKAKAYDKVLEKAKSWYVDAQIDFKKSLETLFPELKETEDERVKRILHSISSKMSSHLRDIFTEEEFQCFDAWSNAWLEKQGEQKSSWSKEDEQYLLVCKNALAKYQTTDKWDANIIYNWLKNKCQVLKEVEK